MAGKCKYCGESEAVPVLDKNIENANKPGNPFRSACLGCFRWLPLSNKDNFRQSSRPHVLPSGCESDDIDSLVPLEEYDYGDEWAELIERINQIEDDQEEDQEAVTDGGEDDGVDESPNRFECPGTGCNEILEGYPDECPVCGGGFRW